MEISLRNRIKCLLAAAIALASFPAAAEPTITPSIALEIFMREKYPKLWDHKAVAIGPAGTYAPGYRAANDKAAERLAIERCEARLKWHPVRALRNAKCKLYAVGKTVVFGNTPAVTNPQSTMLKTIRKPRTLQPRGRVIFLSNCGLRDWKKLEASWHTGWFDLLAVRGFEIVAPSSDVTGTKCARTPWAKDTAVRIRRKAVRTIITTSLKDAPDRPLYVWGDREGAAVALTLDTKVTGIITTGHPCTYADTRNILVHPDARLLIMQGEKQPGLDIASRRAGVRDVATFCASVLKGKPHRAVLIKGMDARAEISRTTVLDKMTRFFRIAIPKLEPSAPENMPMLGYEALMRFNAAYRIFQNHKAVVLGPENKDYVSVARDSKEEARQAALFDCNRAQSGNGFLVTPEAVCVLFVLDDDIVLPQLMEPLTAAEPSASP